MSECVCVNVCDVCKTLVHAHSDLHTHKLHSGMRARITAILTSISCITHVSSSGDIHAGKMALEDWLKKICGR